jgi:hypothetical protein
MSKWTRQKGIGSNRTSETMIARRYSVPAWAAEEIRKAGEIYGSQGRALLAATEILIRMLNPPPPESTEPETLMTLRLHTRTAKIIETLSKTRYHSRAQVFAACMKVLQIKRIKI